MDSEPDLTLAYLAGFHKRDDLIEALKAENKMLIAALEDCQNMESKTVEELRKENADLEDGWQRTYDHDTNKLKNEIEKLKDELLEAQSPCESPCRRGWELIDDNKRLRRLLRERINYDGYAEPVFHVNWSKRVREALGERDD